MREDASLLHFLPDFPAPGRSVNVPPPAPLPPPPPVRQLRDGEDSGTQTRLELVVTGLDLLSLTMS